MEEWTSGRMEERTSRSGSSIRPLVHSSIQLQRNPGGPMPDWPVLSRYDGARLREIAMPIGGIGTGFFALGGRGQLTDWQLMSRPNRGWRPMYCHLLVRTAQRSPRGETVKLRVLEG